MPVSSMAGANAARSVRAAVRPFEVSLTRDDLIHIAPRPKSTASGAIWDAYVSALTSRDAADLFEEYEITSPLRMQHLLATMVCETNLSIIWESGAYTAAGILRVFGAGHHSSAVSEAEARAIASMPVNADGSGPRCEALFERVYGYKTKIGRGMGNVAPGDGWKHRGLGLNQQTGRASQQRAATAVGCSLEDLQKPIHLIHMALVEWDAKECNKWADRDDAVSIRKLINGGSLSVPVSRINGLPNAMAALRRVKAVITAEDFAAVDPDVPRPVSEVPQNEAQPPSLATSTEMHAASATGLGGGLLSAQSLADAAARTAQAGQVSIGAFLMQLASSPTFWVGVLTVAGAAYLGIKRSKRFHIFGV